MRVSKPLLVLGSAAALGMVLLGGLVTPVRAHLAHCNQPGPSKLTTKTLRLRRVGAFASPTYVTGAPGDRRRLFVVEIGGRVRVLVAGRKLRRPFLDLSSDIDLVPDEGMFSMAFAPDYQRTRRFYVFFADRTGDIRIEEFRRSRRSPNRADRRSRRRLLFIKRPGFPTLHYGGQLQFGPDRLLYISLGDGNLEQRRPSQDLGSLLGKILRIDPRRTRRRPYSVPRGNPFVGRSGARREVYLYGLRNPWRFSFDRRTGDRVIGDVGGALVEEVDFLRRARGARAPSGGWNFGWPVLEGSVRGPGEQVPLRRYLPPVLERQHPGAHSLTGGYVVRDRSLRGLYGRYVYGDFCDGTTRAAVLGRPRAIGDRGLGLTVPWLTSFGEDTRGRVYAASLVGPVYRLTERR